MYGLNDTLRQADEASEQAPTPVRRESGRFSIKRLPPSQNRLFGKTIAVAITDSSVQLAAVRHIGNRRQILDIRKEYFSPNETDANGRGQIVSHEIEEFVGKHGGVWTRFILTISSGKETTFRTFLMPALKPRELATAIQYEIRKQIPFPINECVYDYRAVYEIKSEESRRYKIALQAATRRLIDNQMEPALSLGVRISHVYHAQDVIGQLLQHLSEFNENSNYILLNVGVQATEISFYRGTVLEFSHSSPLSSNLLGHKPDKTKYEFFAESITNEIQNSLDFYSGQYSSAATSQIYVYGDLAYSEDLLAMVNSKGGVELKPFPVEQLRDMRASNEALKTVFPVCLPVLAAGVCQASLADLLPASEKRVRKQRKYQKYTQIAAALVLLSSIISFALLNQRAQMMQERVRSLDRQVTEFTNSDAYHTYNVVKREIAFNTQLINKIKESPSYFGLNLKELSNLTPAYVRLFHLDYQPELNPENLYIQGLVTSSDVPPEVLLAEYVEDLVASSFYQNVSIVKYVKKQIPGGFQIEFQIRMRGVA